jgi:Ca2+-transporting ATPase
MNLPQFTSFIAFPLAARRNDRFVGAQIDPATPKTAAVYAIGQPPVAGREGDNAGMQWHRRTAEEVMELLGTSRAGLSGAEAARRLAERGPNAIVEGKTRSWLGLLGAQFLDVPILVLIGAAVIAGFIGDAVDTVVILAIVALNAVIGFSQEFRAERALAALKAMTATNAVAMRDGRPESVPAQDLVPGDILQVDAGSIVPADLRLVEAAAVRTNEAPLTGESVPVEKATDALHEPDTVVAERSNLLHKGTYVTRGRAVGVVVETGMTTEFGRIAALLRGVRAVQTPLQLRLARLGRVLAALVVVVCAIVFTTGVLRGEGWLPMLMTALSLAVAAIPEALPAVVTVSLALGARRMVARHALIRRLPAVETLGSVTFICADKTGTLTANDMRVTAWYCDGRLSDAPGAGPAARRLLRAMSVSHDATVDGEGHAHGDPIETAMLKAAESRGLDARAVARELPRVAEIPFEAKRRCMTTVHRATDGTFVSITKGAPEVIARMSGRICGADGTAPAQPGEIERLAEAMAADGLRVIAFGERRLEVLPDRATPESLEVGLTFLGLAGLIDPPREEVRESIDQCRAAGIVPVMITGDHPVTALAVARELGLATAPSAVITGAELERLPVPEFERRVEDLRIYARVTPEQKLKIVTALQARGECVAMTGDGVNDAPALRQADIGVAMGITGTDVAKEASALVLLDDNFATVVGAVREGRRIYDNLRRFVRYQMTTNSAEVWTLFLAPFLGLPVPLLPLQILWINLVTDGLPGLALAAERAERDVMRRPPRPVQEGMFARGLGVHVLWVGLFMAGLALGTQAWFVAAGQEQARWQTITFTMLCFVQLGHVLAVRSERESVFRLGLFTNRPLLGSVLLAIALQLAIIYLPALNAVFRTVPLSVEELALTFAGAALVFFAVEIEKVLRRGSP